MGIEQTLKRAEIFLGLDDDEIKEIAGLPSSHEENYQPQQFIFRVGDKAEYLYILNEGHIDLIADIPHPTNGTRQSVVVDTITKGDMFGWSALVPPHQYVLSAICRKPCAVTVIQGNDLLSLFERENKIGYKVLQSLTSIIGARLRNTEKLLVKGRRLPFE